MKKTNKKKLETATKAVLYHRYTKLYNGIGNGSNSRDVSVQIPNVT